MRTFYCMLITSAVLTACGVRSQKKPYAEPTDMKITSATRVDYPTVHYFAIRYCLNCHRDRVRPVFSDYYSLYEHAQEINDQISANAMPPQGDGYSPLSACQKLIFMTWLNAGKPKDGGPTLGAAGNACY